MPLIFTKTYCAPECTSVVIGLSHSTDYISMSRLMSLVYKNLVYSRQLIEQTNFYCLCKVQIRTN